MADTAVTIESVMAGSRILKNYAVVRKIDEGGMGAVFLLRERTSSAEAALKIMLDQTQWVSAYRERFVREINHLARASHPNIVTILDADQHNGLPFYLMEFCAGGNANSRRRLPIAAATTVILQVLDALIYLTRVEGLEWVDDQLQEFIGIVHRDLKPPNILFPATDSYVCKVSDFGLAKAFEAAGKTNISMQDNQAGTPEFMPRQQVVDFRYAKPEVDVWAAAACFYFLLIGTWPRVLGDDRSFDRVRRTSPIPIQSRDKKVPDPVARLIDRALDDSREKPGTLAFQSAAEFKDALLAALKQSNVSPTPL
jgi:serine/threonine protein kinase